MRQPPPSEPPKLRGLHPQEDPAGLARLVRSAMHAPHDPVPPLKGRIRSTLRRKSAWRRRYVRAAIVGGIIFVAGAVVGAVVHPIVRFRRLPKIASVENIHPSATRARARNHRAPGAPADLPLEDLAADLAAEQNVDLSATAASEPTSPVAQPSETPALPAAPGPAPSPLDPADRAAATVGPTMATPPAARAPGPSPTTKPASPSASAARTGVEPALASVEVEPGRHASAHPSFRQPLHQPVRTAMLEPPPQYADLPGRPGAPSAPLRVTAATPAPHALAAQPYLAAQDRSTDGAASAGLAPAPLAAATPGGVAPTGAGNRESSLAPAAAPSAPAAKPQPAVQPQPAATPAGEQALLFQAVRSLRALRRPDQALAALDEYGVRFPNGSLLPEANRLRTEALLALGHAPAALDELNRGLGHRTTGVDEHRLVRGELHAHAGRWREALEDFDAVVRARLSPGPTPGASAQAGSGDLLERALWGRASARSQLGDDPGAREALRDYLRRFSDGRFAAQARRLLGSLHRE